MPDTFRDEIPIAFCKGVFFPVNYEVNSSLDYETDLGGVGMLR